MQNKGYYLKVESAFARILIIIFLLPDTFHIFTVLSIDPDTSLVQSDEIATELTESL